MSAWSGNLGVFFVAQGLIRAPHGSRAIAPAGQPGVAGGVPADVMARLRDHRPAGTPNGNTPSPPVGSTPATVEDVLIQLMLMAVGQRGFRGQPRADWRLETSFDRIARGMPYARKLQVERKLIDTFRGEAERFASFPERQLLKESDLTVLMILQHFRGPTRLLDWSSSPLVALYFTCLEEQDQDGAVWWLNFDAFDGDHADDQLKVCTVGPGEDELCRRMYDNPPAHWLAAVRLQHGFPRVMAQQGWFTVSGALGEYHDDLFGKLLPEGQWGKLVIKAGLKRDLLERLERLNVHAVSLQYPGLDLLGARLREMTQALAKPERPTRRGGRKVAR